MKRQLKETKKPKNIESSPSSSKKESKKGEPSKKKLKLTEKKKDKVSKTNKKTQQKEVVASKPKGDKPYNKLYEAMIEKGIDVDINKITFLYRHKEEIFEEISLLVDKFDNIKESFTQVKPRSLTIAGEIYMLYHSESKDKKIIKINSVCNETNIKVLSSELDNSSKIIAEFDRLAPEEVKKKFNVQPKKNSDDKFDWLLKNHPKSIKIQKYEKDSLSDSTTIPKDSFLRSLLVKSETDNVYHKFTSFYNHNDNIYYTKTSITSSNQKDALEFVNNMIDIKKILTDVETDFKSYMNNQFPSKKSSSSSSSTETEKGKDKKKSKKSNDKSEKSDKSDKKGKKSKKDDKNKSKEETPKKQRKERKDKKSNKKETELKPVLIDLIGNDMQVEEKPNNDKIEKKQKEIIKKQKEEEKETKQKEEIENFEIKSKKSTKKDEIHEVKEKHNVIPVEEKELNIEDNIEEEEQQQQSFYTNIKYINSVKDIEKLDSRLEEIMKNIVQC